MDICKVDNCFKPVFRKAKGMCAMHIQREARGQSLTPRPYRSKGLYPWGKWHEHSGYLARKRTVVAEDGTKTRERQFQHRMVMEEMLGRPLRVKENVHHINGNIKDNRPENLELWVTMQPSGQRPEDLVAYAQEILRLYG